MRLMFNTLSVAAIFKRTYQIHCTDRYYTHKKGTVHNLEHHKSNQNHLNDEYYSIAFHFILPLKNVVMRLLSLIKD